MHHPLRNGDINDNRNTAQSSLSWPVAAAALSREMNMIVFSWYQPTSLYVYMIVFHTI